MAELYDYPRFSLAERDRRWAAVRQRMRAQDLAAIVCPAHTGHSTDFQANSRYLSHCGGGGDADIAVVLPLQGEVTVAATSARERWPVVQEWVTDVREARRDYGAVIIARLGELGVRGERVGVTGLGPSTRTPEGTVLHHTMLRMRQAFPDTAFVDATPLLDEVRLIKSEEEIGFLRRSDQLVDQAFDAECAAARPGALDYEVWAAATYAMLRGGSELPVHCNWVSGPAPRRTLTRPSHRRLEAGDMIINELEASWAGYRAQGVQPVCVQRCHPAFSELARVQAAMFERLQPMLRPGVTVGELADACERLCGAERPRSGPAADCTGQLTLHGRGQGDDGPIFTGSSTAPHQLRYRAVPLQERMALIVKPYARSADGAFVLNWGDTVVVRPGGGERLGSREPGIRVA